MDLSGSNFWPKPNVDSRAVLLTPKDDWPGCANPKLFVKLSRALFSSRRKTVRNNLQGFVNNASKTLEYLEKAAIRGYQGAYEELIDYCKRKNKNDLANQYADNFFKSSYRDYQDINIRYYAFRPLAKCYRYGYGTPRDEKKAIEVYNGVERNN